MKLSTLLAAMIVFLAHSPSLAEEVGGTTEYASLADEHVVLIGQWTGTMLVGPKEYPINLWFEGENAMTGRIELIGVTTANNPLDAISIHQNQVTFELASRPPQKFEGEIRNDTMSGTIDISGMRASFSVQKLVQ